MRNLIQIGLARDNIFHAILILILEYLIVGDERLE